MKSNIEIINVGAMVFLHEKLSNSLINLESIQHVRQDDRRPEMICINLSKGDYTYWKMTIEQFVELLKEVNLSVQKNSKEGLFNIFDLNEIVEGPVPL